MNTSNVTFTTEYAIKARGQYYFVASEMNIICSIDIQTKKVEIVGNVPEEDLFTERVCIKIVAWNDEFIFVPMNGKKIWLFHLTRKEWRSFQIKNEKIQRKIRQAFTYKDKLFMIGCHYPAIVCIDLKTEDIQYIDAPYKEVQDAYGKANGVGYFRHDCVIKGNLLYFASFVTNKVLVFNLDDFSYQYIVVGSCVDGYSGIAWDGDSFWLSPRKQGIVVKWDGEESCKEFPFLYTEKNTELMFLGSVLAGKDIVYPAHEAQRTLILHKPDIKDYELRNEKYLFYYVDDIGEIIYGNDRGVITIIRQSGEQHEIECRIPTNELLEKLTNEAHVQFNSPPLSEIMRENKNKNFTHLLIYFDILNGRKDERQNSQKNLVNCGEAIWNRLIGSEIS